MVINKAGRHLLQLTRHDSSVDRDDLAVRELRHEVLLHVVVGLAVGQFARQHDRVQLGQLVFVLAGFKDVGGRLDLGHDLLQRPAGRHPVAEIAVDAVEVLLQEGALAAAQQRLVDDLALAEHVLKAVAGERPGQTPAHTHWLDHLGQRLEPLP